MTAAHVILLVGADELQLVLEEEVAGARVVTCAGLTDATEHFKANTPAVVVCCLDGDGWQLTPLVRDAKNADVAVVAVASNADAMNEMRPLRWSLDRAKPGVIAQIVAELIDAPQTVPEAADSVWLKPEEPEPEVRGSRRRRTTVAQAQQASDSPHESPRRGRTTTPVFASSRTAAEPEKVDGDALWEAARAGKQPATQQPAANKARPAGDDTAAKTAAVDSGELDALRARMSQLEAAVEAAVSDAWKRSTDHLERQARLLTELRDRVEGDSASQSKRAERDAARLLERVDGDLARLSERIDDDLGKLSQRIDIGHDDLAGRLQSFVAVTNAFVDRLETLEGEVGKLRADVGELDRRVEETAGELSDLDDKMVKSASELGTHSEGIGGQLKKLAGEMVELKAEKLAAGRRLDHAESELAAFSERVASELPTRKLAAHIRDLREAQSVLNGRLELYSSRAERVLEQMGEAPARAAAPLPITSDIEPDDFAQDGGASKHDVLRKVRDSLRKAREDLERDPDVQGDEQTS